MTRTYRDAKGRPIVAVTGVGIVTALGAATSESWTALKEGRSGIKQINRFSTDGLRTTVAATVEEPSHSCPALTIDLASRASEQALAQAAIAGKDRFPGPLFLATPPAELEWPQRKALYDAGQDSQLPGYRRLVAAARGGDWGQLCSLFQFASVAEHLAQRFGTRGVPTSVSTACASGATAIQLGVEAIRRGDTQAALCVGADASVQIEALIRFSLLSALSTRNDPAEHASRPFSKDRDGFVMGEGAGALVLESYEAAKARGAEILGLVRGCGEKADSYHRTRSRPDASAIIGAIRNAIDDAGADIDEIDYINAHGTSTPENDKMEYVALRSVLEDKLDSTPISSSKSMIGHTLSAAGAIEAVISFLAIRDGILPPTINYKLPDPEIPLDVVPNVARARRINTVLSNSFGFGGQNAALVLSAP